MIRSAVLASIAMVVFLCAEVVAEPIAEWTFGLAGVDPFTPGATSVDPNATAGVFHRLTYDGGWPVTSAAVATDSAIDSGAFQASATMGVSDASCFEVGIAAKFDFKNPAVPDYTLDLDEFRFFLFSSDSLASSYVVRYSRDSYTSVLAAGTFDTTTDDSAFVTIPLIDHWIPYVTFRIYVTNQHYDAVTLIDDVRINGQVRLIPEPSSTMLLLSGWALGLFAPNRRSRHGRS